MFKFQRNSVERPETICRTQAPSLCLGEAPLPVHGMSDPGEVNPCPSLPGPLRVKMWPVMVWGLQRPLNFNGPVGSRERSNK